MKQDKNPDKVFMKAVLQFHDDVLGRKADSLMSAGGTLGDLMEIFESVLTKVTMVEQEVRTERLGRPPVVASDPANELASAPLPPFARLHARLLRGRARATRLHNTTSKPQKTSTVHGCSGSVTCSCPRWMSRPR